MFSDIFNVSISVAIQSPSPSKMCYAEFAWVAWGIFACIQFTKHFIIYIWKHRVRKNLRFGACRKALHEMRIKTHGECWKLCRTEFFSRNGLMKPNKLFLATTANTCVPRTICKVICMCTSSSIYVGCFWILDDSPMDKSIMSNVRTFSHIFIYYNIMAVLYVSCSRIEFTGSALCATNKKKGNHFWLLKNFQWIFRIYATHIGAWRAWVVRPNREFLLKNYLFDLINT